MGRCERVVGVEKRPNERFHFHITAEQGTFLNQQWRRNQSVLASRAWCASTTLYCYLHVHKTQWMASRDENKEQNKTSRMFLHQFQEHNGNVVWIKTQEVAQTHFHVHFAIYPSSRHKPRSHASGSILACATPPNLTSGTSSDEKLLIETTLTWSAN